MVFADKGTIGATGSSGNNQATLALTTATTNIAAGDLVVLVIADDNIATADGADNVVASISDTTANVYQRAASFTNGQGASQAGATVDIWYCNATVARNTGSVITTTFTNATLSDATGVTGRAFTKAGGFNAALEGTNSPATLANDAADPGALDYTSANIECLRVRGIAAEVGNNTNLTATASWTAWANGNSATTGTTAEMCARAEHRILTATTASSNPTYVAADCASAYVAFKEVAVPQAGPRGAFIWL